MAEGGAFGIKIYGRMKPLKKPYAGIEVAAEEGGDHRISFNVPRQDSDGLVNNKKELHAFKFNRIFPDTTTQEEVFDVVARPVAERYIPILLVAHIQRSLGL